MASSFASFICTVPAGTAFPDVFTQDMNVGNDPVQYIHWRVPPGNRGNLEWFLAQSGSQVLPNTYGTGIVADDMSDVWNLDDIPSNPIWTFVGTNSGAFDHSVYIEFYTEPIGQAASGGGDILAGFPSSDADVPGLWLT